MLRRTAIEYSGGSCRSVSLTLLAVLSVAVQLQICITCTDASSLNDIIDQTITEAVRSSDTSGLKSNPSIERVDLGKLLPAEERLDITRKKTNSFKSLIRERRKAIQNETLRWPNAEVPYEMVANFGASEMDELRQAFEEFSKYTCIRFRPKQANDSDYISIVDGVGCLSSVGRIGGSQLLSLPRMCRRKRTILHALGHAVGFIHEHSRHDRDDYITVRLENVSPLLRSDFDKLSYADADSRRVPYDYLSVMHYSGRSGSVNGQTVIETKDPSYQNIIGTRSSLSFRDVKLANMMYYCYARRRCHLKICPGEGFMGQDCKCWCPSNTTDIAAERCPGCFDGYSWCQRWAQRGQCTHRLFGNFTEDVCPRSCGVCT